MIKIRSLANSFSISTRANTRLTNQTTTLNQLILQRMASTNTDVEDDVLFSAKNLSRVVTLNRPKKLNSLNTSMVSKIHPRLLEYSKSSTNNLIMLNSNSPKGLCAGGDVAECANQILAKNPGYATDFFQKEYNLNFLIGTYAKPYISLMDGITMGGGVGLSIHAPFRVSTEKTKLAMPEMDIGFFPDVGTTFFLPRLDDKVGYYLALTGTILNGLDSYLVGFATHYVPSKRIPILTSRLSNLQAPSVSNLSASNQKQYYQQVNDILEEFTENSLPENAKYPFTTEQLQIINEAFSKDNFDLVLSYLQEKSTTSTFAKETLDKLMTKSPTSLRVGFELMNKGLKNSLRNQLEVELITATNMMNLPLESNDFVKGVKHKLIDKIKPPALPDWTQPPLDPTKLMERSIHSSKLNYPFINNHFNIDYFDYPYHMGLPNNQHLKSFINGSETNKSYLPTPQEVTTHFNSKYPNKLGLDLKIQSVLDLHGDAEKYQGKYVSWK